MGQKQSVATCRYGDQTLHARKAVPPVCVLPEQLAGRRVDPHELAEARRDELPSFANSYGHRCLIHGIVGPSCPELCPGGGIKSDDHRVGASALHDHRAIDQDR